MCQWSAPASRIFALALALFASAASAEPALVLSTEGELLCPTRDQLVQAIAQRTRRSLVDSEAAGADSLALSIRAAGSGRIELELTATTGERFGRTLTANLDECGQLAETAAHLVEAWLRELPWRGDPQLPPSKPLPAPARFPRSSPPPPPPPPPAPPAPAPRSPPELAAPVSAEVRPTPLPQPFQLPKPFPPKGLYLRPAVSAGAFYDASARQVSYLLRASFEIGPMQRWSLGLSASVGGALARSAPPGTAHASAGALMLWGTVPVWPLQSSTLALFAGVGGERVEAWGRGLPGARTSTSYAPVAEAGARLRLPVAGPLALDLAAGAHLRPIRYRLAVEGAGTVQSLGSVLPWAALGVAWEAK